MSLTAMEAASANTVDRSCLFDPPMQQFSYVLNDCQTDVLPYAVDDKAYMESVLSQESFTTTYCRVCGDAATGMYFGAMVCVPCKTFFLRYAGDGFSFVCKNNKDCVMTPETRTHCKYCRYQKCLLAGMKRRVRPVHVHLSEGQQVCVVCNDVANGVHFGVVTCEGCKKFFRRGLIEHSSYSCRNNSSCVINPHTRNSCRYCRFVKCLNAGMSRDAIQMGRPSKMRHVGDTSHRERHVSFSTNGAGSFPLSPADYHSQLKWFAPDGSDVMYSALKINGTSMNESERFGILPTTCQSAVYSTAAAMQLPSMLKSVCSNLSRNGMHRGMLPSTDVNTSVPFSWPFQSTQLSTQGRLPFPISGAISDIMSFRVVPGQSVSEVDNLPADADTCNDVKPVTLSSCSSTRLTSATAASGITSYPGVALICQSAHAPSAVSHSSISDRLEDSRSPYESLIQLADRWELLNDSTHDQVSSEPYSEQFSKPVRLGDDELDRQLAVSEQYWQRVDYLPVADDCVVLSDTHLRIINSSIPAYDRFVSASTKINRSLAHELRVWCEHGAAGEVSSLPDWIQKRVVPIYTLTSITYCRSLIGFQDLHADDQATLIRLGQSPSRILVAACHWFNPLAKDFGHFLSWRTDVFKQMLITYAEKIGELDLDHIESALANVVIVIATDYPGLKRPEPIENLHKDVVSALQAYIIAKYGNPTNRLEQILSHMVELRRLGFLHYRMTKTQNLSVEDITG